MTRTLPPILTLALLGIWLLLNETLAPGHIMLGAALAVFFSMSVARMRPLRPRLRLRRGPVALRLMVRVFFDVVRSNIAVARIILGLRRREIRPGFLDIPLDLRDPHGLAVLAMIVTSTPGTVWAGLADDGRTLTLHVLDLHDEAHWIRLIKQRYEQSLREIFE